MTADRLNRLLALCSDWAVGVSPFRVVIGAALRTLDCSREELAEEFGVGVLKLAHWANKPGAPPRKVQKKIVEAIRDRAREALKDT